jgi:hypothetical protein
VIYPDSILNAASTGSDTSTSSDVHCFVGRDSEDPPPKEWNTIHVSLGLAMEDKEFLDPDHDSEVPTIYLNVLDGAISSFAACVSLYIYKSGVRKDSVTIAICLRIISRIILLRPILECPDKYP